MTLRKHAGRGLFAVTAAALAIGFGATQALASTTLHVTVSGGSSVSASSSHTVLTDKGVSVTCTSSKAKSSVKSATGTSPVTIGSVSSLSFSGCTGPLGKVTVTVNKLPYKLQIDSKTSGGKTAGIVAGVNTHVSTTGCSFNVTGSAPGDYNNSNHTLTMTPTPTPPGLNGAQLTISGVSGCAGLVSNGDHPTYKATYSVSPGVTITSS